LNDYWWIDWCSCSCVLWIGYRGSVGLRNGGGARDTSTTGTAGNDSTARSDNTGTAGNDSTAGCYNS